MQGDLTASRSARDATMAGDTGISHEMAVVVPAAEDPRPLERALQAFAWVTHRVAWRARLLEYFLPMIEREIRSTVRVPLLARPSLWCRGFLAESKVLYDFAANDRRLYVTDYQRFVRTRTINGDYCLLLDDKLQFARLMADFGDIVTKLYGILSNGVVIPPPACRREPEPLETVLNRHRVVVLKPSTGGGGKGVACLSQAPDGAMSLNRRLVSGPDFGRLLMASEGSMVTSYVRQHPRLAAMYPRTTNTVRLMTMQDDECGPFVAAAVLRIGTSRSVPTDNWSRGGLCAPVNLDDGTLGVSVAFPDHARRLTWYTHHPETGAPITGTHIPHWAMVVARMLDLARTFPFLKYVGWDIAVTEDGFRILEGNNFTNVNLFQVHAPLLADPRIAAFFRRHRVV